VHLSAALTRLHHLVHPFLQPQWISSWHATDASEIVLQRGSQPILVSAPNLQDQEVPTLELRLFSSK